MSFHSKKTLSLIYPHWYSSIPWFKINNCFFPHIFSVKPIGQRLKGTVASPRKQWRIYFRLMRKILKTRRDKTTLHICVIMMTSSNRNILRVTALYAGIHRSPVHSPHKGQRHGALVFPLICAWINGWANNREAGDLRCRRVPNDVIVIISDKVPFCESENNRIKLRTYFCLHIFSITFIVRNKILPSFKIQADICKAVTLFQIVAGFVWKMSLSLDFWIRASL